MCNNQNYLVNALYVGTSYDVIRAVTWYTRASSDILMQSNKHTGTVVHSVLYLHMLNLPDIQLV